MYLQPTERHWACDIEADDLLAKATKIHCVCVENLITDEREEFTDAESFKGWVRVHPDCILVGHNFLAYDLVMLNRHWGCKLPVTKVVDTFVLSQLFNPNYTGGHSLAAWGERLRFPKKEHNDFSRFTPEMLEYCRNDTALTKRLFSKLSIRMRKAGFSEEGCELEHLSWNIIQNKQRRYGFPFDYERAHELYSSLREREGRLKDEIYSLWPPELGVVKHYLKRRKRDGSDSSDYLRAKAQYPVIKDTPDGGFDAYDWIAFNLGSPKQRIEKLLELGWEPARFTKVTKAGGGGNPRVDEEQLLEFAESSGTPEVKALAKWIVVNSRANMIRTWMDAYNEKTHAIHGKLYIAGTLRYRHSSPNSANIPAVRLKKIDGEDVIQYGEDGGYSYESRDLWTCGDESRYRLVGIDGKGIQLRVLANYAYSEEFVQKVLDGDPHTNNIKILGLANKAAAKKFLYTLLMGGGGELLAADQLQFGTTMTKEEGEEKKRLMIASIPGFKALIGRLEDELRRTSRIRLCDGTPILVPSPHMVIPYLLQGDESRLMKKASILLDREIRKERIDARKVADIHDEWQFVVPKDDIERFEKLALGVFPTAGRAFNYRIPIEGSVKVGLTWAETH